MMMRWSLVGVILSATVVGAVSSPVTTPPSSLSAAIHAIELMHGGLSKYMREANAQGENASAKNKDTAKNRKPAESVSPAAASVSQETTAALLASLDRNLQSLSAVLKKELSTEDVLKKDLTEQNSEFEKEKSKFEKEKSEAEKLRTSAEAEAKQKFESEIDTKDKKIEEEERKQTELEDRVAVAEREQMSLKFKLERTQGDKIRLQKKLKFIAGKNYVKENKSLREKVQSLSESRDSLTRTVQKMLSEKQVREKNQLKAEQCFTDLASVQQKHARLVERYNKLSTENMGRKAEVLSCKNHLKGLEKVAEQGFDSAGESADEAENSEENAGDSDNSSSDGEKETSDEEADLREQLTDYLVTKPKEKLIDAMVSRMIRDAKNRGEINADKKADSEKEENVEKSESKDSEEKKTVKKAETQKSPQSFHIQSLASHRRGETLEDNQSETTASTKASASAQKTDTKITQTKTASPPAHKKSHAHKLEQKTAAALDDLLKDYKKKVTRTKKKEYTMSLSEVNSRVTQADSAPPSQFIDRPILPKDDYLQSLADIYVNGHELSRATAVENADLPLRKSPLAEFFHISGGASDAVAAQQKTEDNATGAGFLGVHKGETGTTTHVNVAPVVVIDSDKDPDFSVANKWLHGGA